MNRNPIGILDSGVGGLTVAREVLRLLPGEDVIYFGDSANCPYGNRSADEIFELTMKMLRYLSENNVKCVALACNTISTLADRLRAQFPFPLLSIVEAGAGYVAQQRLPHVGLIATEFTVSTGAVEACIHEKAPHCVVAAKGSPTLAALIDRGDFDEAAINASIREAVDAILAKEPVEDLLLSCTHFPIVADNFRACYPQLRLIDPAREQAEDLRRLLSAGDMANPQPQGTFTILTSGDPAVYLRVSERLELPKPNRCEAISLA